MYKNLLDIKPKYQPPEMQGYDLIPILKKPVIKVRKHCLVEEDQDTEDSKDSHNLNR